MELDINTKKTLFVAYPWDIYIKSMYQDVISELFKEWDIRHGSEVTLENTDASEVEKFMNRNKHLYDIFVSAISKSDFSIADVTGTNPNVMLELGVVIQLNKNVLIVISDEHKKIPFDISGRHVSRYQSKDELKSIIKNELKTFEKIKSQDFTTYFDGFYFPFPAEGELKHGNLLVLPLPRKIKNLRMRIEYKFISDSNSHDWLGVHMRLPSLEMMLSELVYVRNNLGLESVSFPGRRTPEIGTKTVNSKLQKEDGFKVLELIILENSLKAMTADRNLTDDKLKSENLGVIALQAWAHNYPTRENLVIRYRNIEIISLDTTAPI